MPKIVREIVIDAPKEIVWNIISDLDSEPEYWYGTKEVIMLSKTAQSTRREIIQNFRNHRILQEVKVYPTDSVEIIYLNGLTEGKKVMAIENVSDKSVRLRVSWGIRYTGLYWFATPFIARHTAIGTEHALERIKLAAESKVDAKKSSENLPANPL